MSKQFCVKGPDTFITGREPSNRACKKCALENFRKWRQKNLKRMRVRSRAWYSENTERALGNLKKWRKANPDKVKQLLANRRALKLKATIGDLGPIKKVYARAQELRQWFDVVVDHIIPLSKGGAHAAMNLQIIYRKENERKNSSLDYEPTVIFV